MLRRALSATAALGLVVVTTSGITGTALAASSSADDPGAKTFTKAVSRVHLEPDGSEVVADKRTITLSVSQTRNLHSRQPIQVSWSGALPTGETAPDPNAPEARQQEHPFMLVECRGVDSTAVPAAQQLSQQTCWTGTARERDVQNRTTGFGPWRLDRYESAADRQQEVGLPSPYPAQCDPTNAKGERRVAFVSVNGVTYDPDGNSCPATPPESVVVDSASQPANTTYATTQLDGRGNSTFTTWTSEDNASLGCGPSVPCSLVAIPIEGISCDVAATSLPVADRPTAGKQATQAQKDCESPGHTDQVGQPHLGDSEDLAVSGSLWFSASNWRNRITVPLAFAPLSNVCDAVSHRTSVDVYGSEVLTQLTAQWRPSFCLNSARTPFTHVQVGEPQAANLLSTGNVDAAFLSRPPATGFSTPTVLAPVSLSGFAISFVVDDAAHNRVTHLNLDARLIAKLMTESYAGLPTVQQTYKPLAHNPLDMSQDPEFIALNPGITQGVSDSAAASTLLDLSSDSDVVQALTSYLAADPEAKDWLYGVPDPWGMTVNPNYTTNPHHAGHLTLPVNNWPLRDSFELASKDVQSNSCLQDSPTPILPLIAAPTARLANIALALQFGNSSAQIVCQTVPGEGSAGEKLTAVGRQSPGYRFILGVTSLGDAARYGLTTASLQTHVDADAPETPTSTKGRTFVSGDAAGLKAAAQLLTPDEAAGTWDLPYDKVVGPGATTGAYPGAMLLSLAAPTKGLDKATATGVAQLMSFAAGPGQVSGLGVGQVPPGFLPLTAANGLGAERAFTVRAATAVAAQHGAALTLAPPVAVTTPSSASPATTSTGTSTSTGTGVAAVPPLTVAGSLPPVAGGARGPVVAPTRGTPSLTPVASSGMTGGVSSGVATALFPLLLLGGIFGGVATIVARRAGRPAAATP